MRQGFPGSDDVQEVLGSTLTGGCTSWTLLVSKPENSQQMLMVQRTRRKLLCRIWRRWVLFLPLFAFSNLPFFHFVPQVLIQRAAFDLRNPEWNI
ncbi:hypothetical protein T01_9746 [Trichinella spiralis]|uniref:Uncharacterized protein n=1 Tax=Trichinella spiralis TaxID=6334 RepID=A0A0V1BM82_TRISP|nr:hypothetical protein T01_9746 [Trichinella spiralis]